MAILTVSAGDLRTIRHGSTAVYSSSAAFQGYLSTGRLVGLLTFEGIGTQLQGTQIHSVTLRPTFGQAGFYGNGDRVVGLYASRYQAPQTDVTGYDHLGRKLGDLTGNGKKTTGTDSTYAGAQVFALDGELLEAVAQWLSGGNCCLAICNDETSLASGYNYSKNYLSITACSLEVEYDIVHTVSFDSCGVGMTPEAVTVTDGSGTVLPQLQAEGYRFLGWTVGEGDDVLTGEYTPAGDVTLYAVWQKLHTVSFDSRGIAEAPAPVTVGDGEVVMLPLLTSRNYRFLGWSADPGATTGMTGNYLPTEDVTLYAIWKLAGSRVAFRHDGKTVMCRVYRKEKGKAVLCRVAYRENGKTVKI